MNGTQLQAWLLILSNYAATAGANLFLQSGVVITVGIAAAHVLRKQGAAVRSLVLRAFLTAVFLCPLMWIIIRETGIRGFVIHIPLITSVQMSSPAALLPKIRNDSDDVHSYSAPQSLPGGSPDRYHYPAPPGVKAPLLTSDRMDSMTNEPGFSATSHKTIHVQARRFLPLNGRALVYLSFAILWITVSLFLIVRLILHHLYIILIRRSAVTAKESFRTACARAAREIGISPPLILQSPSVWSPFLVGIVKPCIFLPLGRQEALLESRAVFLHELAHYRRRDNLWNLFRHIGVALIPYQPLMWILSRLIEETSDYACDDVVMSATGNHKAYARNLIAIADACNPRVHELVTGVGIVSASPLRRRIERILNASRAISLKVSSYMLVTVYSLCLSVVFLAGLVGIRGKSFAQIRTIPETVSRKAAEVTLAAVSAVKEQVSKSLQPEQAESLAYHAIPPLQKTHDRGEGVPLVSGQPNTAHDDSAGSQSSEPTVTDAVMEHASGDGLSMSNFQAAVLHESEPAAAETLEDTSEKTSSARQTDASQPESEPVASPVLSPSQVDIRFEGTDHREYVTAQSGPLEIAVPDGLPSTLLESLENGQENPVWSPTGKLIAFTGRGGQGIWAIPVQGGRPSLALDNTGESLYDGSVSPRGKTHILCFTPDGGEITFVKYIPKINGFEKKTAAEGLSLMPVIESVNIRTGERREIVKDASEGCWSPDSRYFVYVDGDYYGISVLDLTSGESKRISGTGKSPTITPDGEFIIYVDWSWDATDQLFRAPIEGGQPEQLTGEGLWWNPKCSPDGEWVLCSGCVIEYGSYALLRAYNLKNQMAYDLVINKSETAEMGDWSPSGRQFCYTLYGGAFINGKNIKKSTIYISDFGLWKSAQPDTAASSEPVEFKLIGNFPNPFNPSTTIRFSLPGDGFTELVIYSITGQKIRELVSQELSSGIHSVVWDGRDQNGIPVSSGIYISRLKMEGKVETGRMTLVK
ncbi:T9SS type A sorting domain-containing protein [bacterium]|nr:T9SS type A sorting domain-containing protein [bacterium]